MQQREVEAVQRKLLEFAKEFAGLLPRSETRNSLHLYLSGLLLDGERKSMQPMAERLPNCNQQNLHQFISESPWDSIKAQELLMKLMEKKLEFSSEGVLILDDTTLPKKGYQSVGVARQYCGALGKIANCQCLVSWQMADKGFHIPLVAELYVPEEWTSNPARMKKALVPERRYQFQEKWKLALSLLDRVNLPHQALVFDAGYGNCREFLARLDQKGKKFVGQIPESSTFWDIEVPVDRRERHASGNGRPRKHLQVANKKYRPKSAKEWADVLFKDSRNIHRTKLPLKTPRMVQFVFKRVYETVRSPFQRVGSERWLVVEQLRDGSRKYFVSNFDEKTTPQKILHLGHQRWTIEQGYQQLKEELGLDHFEGRSWVGLHHHITMCFMAFDFLVALSHGRRRPDKSSRNSSRHTKVV